MKKTFKFLIFILIVSSLLFSCSSENGAAKRGSANLRIELNRGIRLIAPNSTEMEVKSYRIELTSPDGTKLQPIINYYTYYTVEDIQLGTWHIEVWGRNSSGVDISYGEKEVTLTRGTNTVTIDLDRLVGKGNLNCTITWDKDEIPDGSIRLFLTQTGKEENEVTSHVSQSPSQGSAHITLTDLDAGSYTLRGVLYSNNGKTRRGGFSEAVRISNGMTLKGNIDLKAMLENSDVEITFANLTSLPLEAVIHGVSSIVKTRDSFISTIEILTPNVDSSKVSCQWYLDGIFIDTGLSCEIRPTNDGEHRLDAVFSTSQAGSTGSASAFFTAVENSVPGSPYRINKVSDIDGKSLGLDVVATFLPDGTLIVASNSNREIYTVTYSGNGQTMNEKSYSYDILNVANNVIDIATAADAEDYEMTVYVVSNTNPSITALNYNRTSDSLSTIRKETTFKTSDNAYNIAQFGEATPFVSSNGEFRYVAVSATSSSFEQAGFISLKEIASVSDQSFVALNNVIMNPETQKNNLTSLNANTNGDSVTITTTTGVTTYILEISNSLPSFKEHFYTSRNGDKFGTLSDIRFATYLGESSKDDGGDWGYIITSLIHQSIKKSKTKSSRLEIIYGAMTDEEHRNAFKTASGTMDGKTFIFLDGEKNLLCGMDLDCNRYSPVSDEIEDSLLIDPYSDTYYVESKILGSLPVNASKYNAIELCENGQKGVLFNRGGGNGSGLLVFDIIPR